MKAIIIAAGPGSRLKELTKNTPKCLLEINGKSTLKRAIDTFHKNGINDINIVVGYKKEKIQEKFKNLKYFENDNFYNNNILLSLMYARDEMNEEFIASYSDIIFADSVVRKLTEAKDDVAIVVAVDWKKGYEGRTMHTIEQAENVAFNKNGNVIKIGKFNFEDQGSNAPGEFIGMLKCTKKGAETFKKYFEKAKKEFSGKPFITAKTFEKAYITDFIQYLVNNKIKVKCVFIKRNWKEIDTIEDVKMAENLRWIKNERK